MSNRALTWAFEQSTGSAGRKAVLVALADMADERHACWPSQATLARMTDQSERAVRGHLAALQRAGFITRRRQDADGHRTTDRYVLAVAVAVGVTNRQDLPVAESAGSSQPADSVIPTGRICQETPKNPNPEPTVPGAAPEKKPRKAAAGKGTRIDPLWVRSDRDKAWQATEDIPDDFARIQTAQFKDYWQARAGAGGVKRDWSATWRVWMRKAWHGRDGDDHRRRAGVTPLRDFAAEREAAAAARRRARFDDPSAASGLR